MVVQRKDALPTTLGHIACQCEPARHNIVVMGIGDSGILSVGADMNETLLEMVDQLVDDESGIISLYYGEDVSEEDAQSLADQLQEKYEDLEVEVNDGGQPIYYYILSVE